MNSQESLVDKSLIKEVKQEIFSSYHGDLYSLVPPSPYDTAWISMIPDPQRSDQPLFRGCLDWVLHHQNTRGFWGDTSGIHSLTSTLASIVALSTWNVGHIAIRKGLAFIHSNTGRLLEEKNGYYPEWFVIVFPAMVELAETKGLHVSFSRGSKELVQQVFLQRQQILKMQRWDQQQSSLALVQYLEALPAEMSSNIYPDEILLCQSGEDGFIHSPSARAYAFMKTGNKEFLANLNFIAGRRGFGASAIYTMDEDLPKLLVIDQIETLGLAEHFFDEITSTLGHVYRNYISCKEPKSLAKLPLHMYRDSLAFRLLRLHGYAVSPEKFCRFFEDEDTVMYMEEHHEIFLSAMYNVYRATDVGFMGENLLIEDVRAFSKRILEKETINMPDQIKHELGTPWLARLDHLEHRRCIERKQIIGPWTGKSSPSYSAMLLQLALKNYTKRQSIFRNELEELERWAKDMGLSEMGFARQKTTYCYYAVASTAPHPSLSDIRMAVVKAAVIVTVADDFFDREGSMDELEALANAVKSWQQKGLSGYGKSIFTVLKDHVDDLSNHFFNKNGYDIKRYIRNLWHQTFESWLKEAEWSRSGHEPSIAEYLQVATISIASHTILLTAALLLNPPPKIDILKFPQSHPLTSLLMLSARLLNEIRSYQKEQEEGKPNLVLLHMKENPNLGFEESIGIIQELLDDKKKELLEQALMGDDDMPEACKQLHLSCLKVFQMFFNSSNAFDSPTELLADINKAIYDPILFTVDDLDEDHVTQGSAPLKSLKNLGTKKVIKSMGSSYGQVGKGLLQVPRRSLIGTRSSPFSVVFHMANHASICPLIPFLG